MDWAYLAYVVVSSLLSGAVVGLVSSAITRRKMRLAEGHVPVNPHDVHALKQISYFEDGRKVKAFTCCNLEGAMYVWNTEGINLIHTSSGPVVVVKPISSVPIRSMNGVIVGHTGEVNKKITCNECVRRVLKPEED